MAARDHVKSLRVILHLSPVIIAQNIYLQSNPTPRIISCVVVFLNNILNFSYLGEGTRADNSHWGYITPQQHNASVRVLFFFPTLGSDPSIAAGTQVKDVAFRLLQMSFSKNFSQTPVFRFAQRNATQNRIITHWFSCTKYHTSAQYYSAIFKTVVLPKTQLFFPEKLGFPKL